MKKLIFFLTLFAITLSACAPAAAPEPVATVDIVGTTEAMAREMLSGTLTAMPTQTPLPTETPMPTPTETETPMPAPTETEIPSPTPAQGQEAFEGVMAGAGVAGQQSMVIVFNQSKFDWIYLTIEGTQIGERPYFAAYKIEGKEARFDLPYGRYSFRANMADKKIFTGNLVIKSQYKTEIIFQDGKVSVRGH